MGKHMKKQRMENNMGTRKTATGTIVGTVIGGLLALCSGSTCAQYDDYDNGDAGASGQVLGGRHWFVSPMLTYTAPDPDRGTDYGIGGQVSLGRKVTDGLTLGIGLSYASMSGDGGDAQLIGAGAEAMAFLSRRLPNLYGVLALGYGDTKDHPGAVPDFTSAIVFDVGAGYLIGLSRELSLRVEGRYRTDQHDTGEAGEHPGQGAFSDGVFGIGVLYALGLPPEEAPAADGPDVVDVETADSDNDGVGDDYDQCPGSAAGAVVDASGCDAPTDGADTGMDDSATGLGLPGEDAALHDAPSEETTADDGTCRVPSAGEQIDDNGCAVD